MNRITSALSLVIALLFTSGLHAIEMTSALQKQLDRLTGSERTLNRVALLQNGQEAWPARQKALAQADHFVLQAVPFWYNDDAGRKQIELMEKYLRQNSQLQFHLMVDWSSPLISKDPFQTFQFAQLKDLPRTQVRFWNSPDWALPWSQDYLSHRVHEKLLIVDGKTLFMGGMNVGDGHLSGAVSEKGWRDTDVMIQGPLVQSLTRSFLHQQVLIDHFDQGGSVPAHGKDLLKTVLSWIWPELSGTRWAGRHQEMGLFSRYGKLAGRLGFDANEGVVVSGTTPVRLIRTNSLENSVRSSGRSKMFDVLEVMLPHVQKNLRVYAPYMSWTEGMVQQMTQLSRRGVRVQLITNSQSSNDVEYSYFAGLSVYPELLKAGVEIYEWQGHQPLMTLMGQYGCKIKNWPGRTLHSKVLILDENVLMIGSHNLNVRSERHNSEAMALIEDRGLAKRMVGIFERDIETRFDRDLACESGRRSSPPLARRLTLEKVLKLVQEHQADIKAARQIMEYM